MGNDPSRRAKSSGLSGFVSFKRRKDAEVALRELDGTNWAGSALRVGWSKAVPTSGRVLYGKLHKSVSLPWILTRSQAEETQGLALPSHGVHIDATLLTRAHVHVPGHPTTTAIGEEAGTNMTATDIPAHEVGIALIGKTEEESHKSPTGPRETKETSLNLLLP